MDQPTNHVLRKRCRHTQEQVLACRVRRRRLRVLTKLFDIYEFLAREYEPDDKVFIFGFSRGAASVIALADVRR
ncbi:MAG: hypothetical protein HN396_09475 [Gemmatimonadales bacterium]|nr:hypothetical protein [Gemmatimonadales bacterium]NCG33238.1 hypothetical protein [Pseudomonadota bacterium]MBT3500390.1 hypothetical protein [Gemmatimonadales bacterium]MBT3774566.1 hypothetical protein [Gemmatimonadales bacterium]MBT3958195.1 hypothetical protein [Gemmatimonadales bacterium]